MTAAPSRSASDSLTMRAILSAAVPALATALGGTQDQWAAAIAGVWALVSLTVALYGRWRVGDLHLPTWLGGRDAG